MIIKSPRKKIPDFNIHQIERKEYIKYLGVYLDQHLNWNQQLKIIHSKISKNLGVIRQLRFYVSFKTLKNIYYSLIYPYLAYGILSWGSTYKTKLSELQKLQNKCIRCMFFCNRFEHAMPLYNISGLLTLKNIFIFNSTSFAHKILNNNSKVPSAFRNILKQSKDQHCYNTRYASQGNLVRPSVRTNYGKFTFKFSICENWENIPFTIKQLNFSLFKSRLRLHLLSIQAENG